MLAAPPQRRLTIRQQRALDAFIEFGANIHSGFASHELRSAFLALARRYHPDRHPFAGEIDRARLSRVFADLANHHQMLLTAIEPASVAA